MPRQKTEHASMYANLLMYRPWQSEADYLGNAAASEESCQAMWETEQVNCQLTSEELKRMIKLSQLS